MKISPIILILQIIIKILLYTGMQIMLILSIMLWFDEGSLCLSIPICQNSSYPYQHVKTVHSHANVFRMTVNVHRIHATNRSSVLYDHAQWNQPKHKHSNTSRSLILVSGICFFQNKNVQFETVLNERAYTNHTQNRSMKIYSKFKIRHSYLAFIFIMIPFSLTG